MESLAVTAVIVLLLAILGGPATLLLSRASIRGRTLFFLHRIFTTVLGIFSILMGFTLVIAHVSIVVRLLGAMGLITGALGIARLYRRRIRR
jgi:hypothetical protein